LLSEQTTPQIKIVELQSFHYLPPKNHQLQPRKIASQTNADMGAAMDLGSKPTGI
jgi:hypothetical protein